MPIKTTNPNCVRCRLPMQLNRIFKQSYCKSCHNEYMRSTRPKQSELDPLAKEKANARSYANVYLKYGKIKKKPCEVCGSEKSQMHHEDYSKPLEVRWLCRDHHLELHGYPQ